MLKEEFELMEEGRQFKYMERVYTVIEREAYAKLEGGVPVRRNHSVICDPGRARVKVIDDLIIRDMELLPVAEKEA